MRRIIRKDNLFFVLKVFGSFLGFIITNFSLIVIGDFMTIKKLIIFVLCLMFLGYFIYQIHRRYSYYRSFALQLKRTNKPLFLICTYLAKIRTRDKDKKVNSFNIEEMEITYNINSYNIDNEIQYTFSVLYHIPHARNGLQKCSKIYYTSLSSRNNMTVEYQINNEKFTKMNDCSYYDDLHFQLWDGVKSGQSLNPNENFSYSIRVTYNDVYNQLHGNRFLIDPSNYGNHVNRISVKVCSDTLNVHELFNTPISIRYYNGLNTEDINNTNRFTKKSIGSTAYFELSLEPTQDEIFVIEVFPKKEANTNKDNKFQ